MSSPENALYEVLKAAVAAAPSGHPLELAAVHSTVYETINQDRSIRIGNCESLLHRTGNNEIGESDAQIPVQVTVRVAEESPEGFADARDAVRDIAKAVIRTLLDDETLGGEVCDLVIQPAFRGWATVRTTKYAAAVIPVVINPRQYGVEI